MESTRVTKDKETDFQIIASDDNGPYIHEVSDDFGSGFKTCKECGKPKSLLEFRVEPKGIGGRKSICKICMGVSDRKKARKNVNVSNDMIRAALEAAAYRIILERM